MDLLDDDDSPLIKEGSPPPTGMDMKLVFTVPAEFRGGKEQGAYMFLGPRETMFEKPKELSQHLKPLYIQSHIDKRPISRMLIDHGVDINLMPYSIFKKLGREDDKIRKTNLTLSGVGGDPMEARGVVSMELTIGCKSFTTVFFIIEMQGNYSVILGHDWIHANCCVPSTLHQFLIQWIDDEIEVVHADVSAYITLVDAMANW
jgi:hypothetical protein